MGCAGARAAEYPWQVVWLLDEPPVTSRFILARTLLFGVALIASCGGLQGTLLGIRASLEGFSLDAIGLVMSAYYMGFLVGAWLVPRSVRQVGHIRVFAALASMASVTILLHSVYVEPAWWFLFRLLTGFCFSGLYLVAESWLNAISTNDNRGRLLAAYMFTVALGFIAGQFTVTLWPPGGFEPFILASVILSVAMIPVLLSAIAAPPIEVTERLQMRRFVRTAPLGAVAVFVQGMTFGALMWLTAVFGRSIGHSVSDSSVLVGMLMAGGLAALLPIGRLSDLRDRRLILLLLAVAAAALCLLVPWAAAQPGIWLPALALFALGGAVQPLYSVSISFINDHLDSRQILSASGGIILVNGLGGMLGPFLGAQTMSLFGPASLYYFVALLNLVLSGYTLYRIQVRAPIAAEDQTELTPVVMQTSQVIVANAMDEADTGDFPAPVAGPSPSVRGAADSVAPPH